MKFRENFQRSWKTYPFIIVVLTSVFASISFLSGSQQVLADAFKGLKGGSANGLLLTYTGSISLVAAKFYTVVKRVGTPTYARRMGGAKLWLSLHVGLSFIGLVLVLLHAGLPFQFKYAALLSGGFAGLATWLLIGVSVSGVFGRYLFKRLPMMQKEFRYWRQAHLVIVALLFMFAVAHMTTTIGED
ncbi:MAG: hypothetical protein HYU39_04910 [Thaumarchaeota archaeon]|nr:hypothetical protein [Nitrososphaerota archaeon]